MNFIPLDKIEWKKVRYLKIPLEATDDEAKWLYEFWLNEPLASWDVFSYWEKERIFSMREHLKKGDVLFDIGSEQGWCNLVYADMVGAENMVLIEPTPEFWPNIKALWCKNFPNSTPKACYSGFFGSLINDKRIDFRGWPLDALSDSIIDRNSYRYLNEHKNIPQITIDEFVKRSGIIPDALTMDTEGAELLILKGATKTLRENNVKVWVSEHDDLAKRNFGVDEDDIAEFMAGLGYEREVLATDHERHVYYAKSQ